MNLYVGNLPYSVSEDELNSAFSACGTVTSAKIVIDKFTGKPKGFAFVEMADKNQGMQAISELNGTEMSGRTIVVSEAHRKDRNNRSSRPMRD